MVVVVVIVAVVVKLCERTFRAVGAEALPGTNVGRPNAAPSFPGTSDELVPGDRTLKEFGCKVGERVGR